MYTDTVVCRIVRTKSFFIFFKWKISFAYVRYKHNFLYFLIEMTFVNSHTQKNMLGMFSVETHT